MNHPIFVFEAAFTHGQRICEPMLMAEDWRCTCFVVPRKRDLESRNPLNTARARGAGSWRVDLKHGGHCSGQGRFYEMTLCTANGEPLVPRVLFVKSKARDAVRWL